jgi:hypothetical protein
MLWSLPNRANWNLQPSLSASVAPSTVLFTCGATPHTKGAYVAVETATAADWLGFWVGLSNSSTAATDTSTLMDIALGAAGAEVVIFGNWPIGYHNAGITNATSWFYVPLFVKAGSRVSVRGQAAVGGQVSQLDLCGNTSGHGLVSDEDLFGYCTTIGADTSTSRGPTFTTGAVDVYGTPTELSPALPVPVHAVLLGIQGAGGTVLNNVACRAQLMSGAAGAEVIVARDFYFQLTSSESRFFSQVAGLQVPMNGLSLPKGARLAARVGAHQAAQTCDLIVAAFTR